MRTEWAALAREVSSCRACAELALTRQRVVVGDPGPGWATALPDGDPGSGVSNSSGGSGDGPDPGSAAGQGLAAGRGVAAGPGSALGQGSAGWPATRLVFVGEAPGAQEDAAGRPFVGKAGQLLDQLLTDSGMARAEVGVVNVIKCRPPGNRRPSGDEIARCRPYLERQLELLRPRLIVALGLTAVAWFLGRRTTLAAARGVVHEVDGYRVIATYHPSAAIRFGPAGAPMAALREDLDFAARYPRRSLHMRLSTVDDTWAFGRRLASVLRAGDLVILSGPLGAGKTALAQGIGAGLGIAGEVTSPTFVIARVHRGGRVPLVHADAYRLGTVADPRAEVDDLDLDASLEESVTLVEWGEGMVEQLSEAYLEIRIDRHDDDSREVALVPHAGDWSTRLAPLC